MNSLDDPVRDLALQLQSETMSQWLTGFEEMWGPDRSDCGGWTSDPPCGGCYSCGVKQVVYGLPDYQVFYAMAAQQLGVVLP